MCWIFRNSGRIKLLDHQRPVKACREIAPYLQDMRYHLLTLHAHTSWINPLFLIIWISHCLSDESIAHSNHQTPPKHSHIPEDAKLLPRKHTIPPLSHVLIYFNPAPILVATPSQAKRARAVLIAATALSTVEDADDFQSEVA